MSKPMTGKTALVTGASAGIGRATALAFAQHGANVVVSDVAEAGGNETVRLIEAEGGTAIFVRADVANAADVAALVQQAVATYGHLDYAFNNAGIEGTQATLVDYPEDMWRRVLDINLTGVWLCMKHEIPAMLQHGGGAIVNMASILGKVGSAHASAYVAAKHGVVGLTKAAALEYSAQGVRVNAVCPAFILTEMLDRSGVMQDPVVAEAMANLHPIKRMGKPEEIAAAVVWLCSEGASFITGEALMVDGGYVAQ